MAFYHYYSTAANATPALATDMRAAFEAIGLTVVTLDFSAASGNFVLCNDANGNEVFKWATNNVITVCGQTIGISNLMYHTSAISIAATGTAVCLMSAQGSNPAPCRETVIISKSGTRYMGFCAYSMTESNPVTWDTQVVVYNMEGGSQVITSLAPSRSSGNPICGFSLGTIDGQYMDKCYWCIYAPPLGVTSTGTVAGTPCVLINGYVLMME